MFAQLLTPAYTPFVFSFLLMIGIGLIEVLGFGLGHLDLDSDATPDAGPSALGWLGLGDEMPVPMVDGVSSAVRHAELLVALRPRAPRGGSFAAPPVKPHAGLPQAIATLLSQRGA